jgi:hypothetical protein
VGLRGQIFLWGAAAWACVLHGQSLPESLPEGTVYERSQLESLPNPFSLWGILQSQEAPAVAAPLDFGGLRSNRLALLSGEAITWTGAGYSLNGFDASDPYQPGRPIFLVDPAVIESITVKNGPRPASSSVAGVETAVLTRSAGEQWHCSLSSHFTASRFASGNLPSNAAAAGLLRSEAFRWYTRDNAQLGGPIGHRADVVASGTGQWASQRVARDHFQPTLNSRLLFGSARGRFRPSASQQIDGAFTGSRIDLSGFGMPAGMEALVGRRMAPPFRLPPDLREVDHLDSTQVAWTRTGAASFLQVLYGYGTAHLNTAGPQLPGYSRLELLDGAIEGPPPLANLGIRSRHQVEGVWRASLTPHRGIRHSVTAGASWRLADIRNRFKTPGDLQLIVAAGHPDSVLHLNTPLDSRARVTAIAYHGSDSVQFTQWLSAYFGLLGETTRGSVPPQSSPAGAYAPARQFPRGATPIAWTNWAPRMALALSLPWSHAPVLRASYSRYYYPPAARYLDLANPNSLSGEEYQWQDRNADLSWQPGETGTLLRRFGGAYSRIDASARRPYVDEFTAGAEAVLPASLRASLHLFRRDDRDRLAAVNTGAAFRLRSVLDPGPDFVVGTFDDQILPVYEQEPASFGRDQFVLINPGLRSLSAGLVAKLSRTGKRHWWRLTFVAEKGYGPTNFGNAPWENDPGVIGSLYQDPNILVNAAGRIYFDRAFLAKFQGASELPSQFGGLELGVLVDYWDGLPFGRKLLVTGLAQGPLMVAATPRGSPEGGHRTEFNLTLDLRVSRRIKLPAGSLRVLADVFNLPNFNYHTVENDLSGAAFNQRLPIAIQPPRFVRLGMEYNF